MGYEFVGAYQEIIQAWSRSAEGEKTHRPYFPK